MKKGTILFTLVFICLSGGLIAHKTGVVTNQQKDRTGSPVSQTQQCGQCHNNGNFNTSITMRLKDANGDVVTEYLGGENYTFEVELSGSGAGFGFQAVALLSGNANAGNFTVNSSNAKIMTLNNRKYAEQVTRSTSGLFVMNWTAPSVGSGTVNFYSAGNCVNGNNTSSGDQSVIASPLTITESNVSAVFENDEKLLRIYPNPSTEYFNIDIPSDKEVILSVYSSDGKVILSEEKITGSYFVTTHNWEKGLYFVRVSGEINIVKSLVVQ